jgi:hypothetical protein
MRSEAIRVLYLAPLAAAAWLGGCAGPAQHARATLSGRAAPWACTFEDGTPQGWAGTGGASVRVCDEHPASGHKSLRADLPPGPYPGIGMDFATPQDWAACQALRFRVFNASGGPVTVCVRVDDADSKDFSTRYNNDMDPHRLAPGANEVEVPIAALRQGGFLSRGLDVSRIRTVRVFSIALKSPVALFFGEFRLISQRPSPPGRLVLADLAARPPKWFLRDGAGGRVAPGPTPALELELPAGSPYPGVSFPVTEQDWLGYDLLSLEVHCPADAPSPQAIGLKIMDAVGRSQTVACPLRKGANSICIPLEMVSSVSLGRVTELALFAAKPPTREAVRLSAPVLHRTNLVQHPPVRDATAAEPALTLDLSDFKVPRNTCFLAMVYVPLADGRTRVVRCNSPGRGEVRYAIGADAFVGVAAGRPIPIWVYVSDHGSWCWWRRDVACEGKPLVVRFE